jgi:hypothetical protein
VQLTFQISAGTLRGGEGARRYKSAAFMPIQQAHFPELRNIPGTPASADMQHLENSCRTIADMCLHDHIRRKESLPNENSAWPKWQRDAVNL